MTTNREHRKNLRMLGILTAMQAVLHCPPVENRPALQLEAPRFERQPEAKETVATAEGWTFGATIEMEA
jgi:hypothetical protein